MDTSELAKAFEALKIPRTHATVGLSNSISSNKQFRSLLVNRRLPDKGWTDVQIQSLLFFLATLDTNNKTLALGADQEGDTRWCGVGEREGRVFSSLVSHRHYGLSHGMGRSGDITEPQPKAVGSSVLVKLTLLLALDALRRGSGLSPKSSAAHGILLPLCTGMSMSLLLTSLRTMLPEEDIETRRVVLWSRIDQKSCFKAILSAGLECVIVQTSMNDANDEVVTNESLLEEKLREYEGRVLAVITATSCFAPRVHDKVDVVAKICDKYEVFHVVNNAYGLQCGKTCKLINRACTVGRVDAIVCSTDKNFLVPVGGAIITSPEKQVVESVGKVYAGRASSSPIVDLFITLLAMGIDGYRKLLSERAALLSMFAEQLSNVAEKHGERLLQCPSNTISFGITLDGLARPRHDNESEDEYLDAIDKSVSEFGAMLFSRCVSGTRVIPRGQLKVMGGKHNFHGFGSSYNDFPHAYMTAACAIGVTRAEVEEFFVRLDRTLQEYKSKKNRAR